jgi:hypothetical protein
VGVTPAGGTSASQGVAGTFERPGHFRVADLLLFGVEASEEGGSRARRRIYDGMTANRGVR